MIEPVKVNNWPFGYCDNKTHWGTEHPLYTSSDNGCIKFITSERLLEIKQLFDLTIENELLRSQNDKLQEQIDDANRERNINNG
jgi:hypothetical protein